MRGPLNNAISTHAVFKVDELFNEDSRQLLRFCSGPAKVSFGMAALQLLVVLGNRLLISALVQVALLTLAISCVIAREFVLRKRPRLAIGVVCTTMLAAGVFCTLLDPKIAPVALLGCLLAVGLAMPFVNSRELKIVCIACAGSIVLIGYEFVFLNLFHHDHTLASDISMFVAMCAAGWVCLSWLLGFHTRLFNLVKDLRTAQTDLEGQVSTRTMQLQEELNRALELEMQIRRAREQIILAREEERRRLRRELHDEFAPTISGCILTLDGLRDYVVQRPQSAPEVLARVCKNLRGIVVGMRELAYTLFLPVDYDLGLRVAITQMVERLRSQYSAQAIAVSLSLPASIPELPAAVEIAVLRIIQESLTNVHRHAEATRCEIAVEISSVPQNRAAGGGVIEVRIHDDGKGIKPNQIAGVGVSAMRERASELGGTFTLSSSAPGGTLITALIPFANQRNPEEVSHGE